MEDYMLLEYLKGGMRNREDHELIHKFKEFMRRERDFDNYRYSRDFEDMNNFNMDPLYNRGYYRRGSMRHNEGYMDEHQAKQIVSEMYHEDKGNHMSGEHFSMHKAQEVYNKYRSMLGEGVTPVDVYVAINAQYHDYCALYKSWFGTNIDDKVITSALVFWFKDADYSKGSKLRNYFEV